MNEDSDTTDVATDFAANGPIEPSSSTARELSAPADWSAAAVRLLQGVVYHDDNAQIWDSVLRSVSPLTDYFAKIGLLLIVDESDGMAYLKQLDDDEVSPSIRQCHVCFAERLLVMKRHC